MRTILLSAANRLIPELALIFPIGSALFHVGVFIQPTPPEIIAFMAGAFAAAFVSVASCSVKCNTTPSQESRHD